MNSPSTVLAFSNLAGSPGVDVDAIVLAELFMVGVEAFRVEARGEVRTRFEGRLEAHGRLYTLRRAWRYWVVNGLVPLSLAERIYGSRPYGLAARVAGHAASPRPEDPWLTYLAADGREVVMIQPGDSPLFDSYRAGTLDPALSKRVESRLSETIVVSTQEERSKLYVSCGVVCYHIDTLPALRTFVDFLKSG